MSVGDDLLDAVLAAPDDDAPRLAYADYLLERGDPRGELIVVQCTAARLDRASDAARRARLRARQLLDQYLGTWFGELGHGHHYRDKVRRGFLAEITITPRNLRERWELCAREPIEHVTFRNKGRGLTIGDLAWLARRARPRKVTIAGTAWVELDGARLFAAVADRDPGDATRVLAEGQLLPDGALRDMVTGIGTSEVLSATWLAAAPPLAWLRAFTAGDGAMAALVEAPQLRGLRELTLYEMDPFDFRRLAAAGLPDLRKLTVYGDIEVEPLVAGPLLRSVEHLDTRLALDVQLVDALERSAVHELRCGAGTADGVAVLAASATARRLTAWRCSGFTDEMAPALVEAPLRALEWLQLSSGRIGDDTARAIARCPALHVLARLELSASAITDDGARALAACDRLARLEFVDLRASRISEPMRAELAARWPDATIAF